MVILRKYGVQTTFYFPLVDAGAVDYEATPVTHTAGDTQISKDGGAFANTTNAFAHEGNGIYSIVLTATEMQAANIVVTIIDSATKAWEDQAIIIDTYGNASGQHAIDLDDAVRAGLTALPNAAADAAGGLPISDAGGLDIDGLNTNVSAILLDTGTDGVAISASTINAIADQVWDENAADHVAAGSFGARLSVIRSNTAQGGASTTITLDASASATDDFYNNTQIEIVAGTGAGQKRFITDYNGTSKVATVDTWAVNPSSDSVFVITGFGSLPGATAPTAAAVADAVWDEARGDHTSSGSFGEYMQPIRIGTAQAGGASSITLDASASATNDLYNYALVKIISGTGAGQTRQISDYNGSSKVATVSLAWTTQPSSDSVFVLDALGVDAATVASIADGVWDESRAAHVTAGSFGERVNANVTQISGDTTAADNLESYCDGTTPQPVNMTQISGDAVAADNLESYCDGTTPQPVNATQISGDATAADSLEAALDGTGGVTLSADLSGSVGSVTGDINTSGGTITNLDGLDTAQDTQHASTRTDVAAAQTSLDNLTLGVIFGTAQTGTLSATVATTDLTGYADDELIGRVIVFTGGTANGQAAEITDYASTNGTITFAGGVTTAPTNGDTFKVV